jgi:hypothetical protein
MALQKPPRHTAAGAFVRQYMYQKVIEKDWGNQPKSFVMSGGEGEIRTHGGY